MIADMNTHKKILLSTEPQSASSSPPLTDSWPLVPCSDEEADTRLVLHANDCFKCGLSRVMIRSTVRLELISSKFCAL